MNLYKRYVDVILKQTRNGKSLPLYICWDNGIEYKIDRIISTEKRASQVGGCGLRYVCMIQGAQRNLFLEKDRWFIESYQP
jgi:hypothetical protein